MESRDIKESAVIDAPASAGPQTDDRAPLRLRLINLFAVLVPFAGLVIAIALLWGVAFDWVYLALLIGMYVLTSLGVTVGYHRYFTHRSFDTPRAVGVLLAALGSMAVEGPVIRWVATHRLHHQHSDKQGDPHSPHAHGGGVWGTVRGLWHAHMGWLLTSNAFVALRKGEERTGGSSRYAKDLESDAWWRWMSRLFPFWVCVGLLLPAAVGGLVTMSWTGALLGFIWGGLVRVLLLHHVTWSINSVCHIWGTRPFRSHDESRNNAVFGVLAMGEGWHNNHHAFPTSARHGLRWWEVDVSWMLIWGMSKVGLASGVRVPGPDRIEAKRTGAVRR